MNCVEFKVCFGGDTAVGKSSIAKRFINDNFDEKNESTIGAAYFNKYLEIDDKKVNMGIWDTAGQERYQSLAPMYFRNSQAVILVYDVTSQKSFQSLKNRWYNDVQSYIDHDNIAIFENKSDLEEMRQVDEEEARKFAEENDILFYKTSAKEDNGNIEKCLRKLYENKPIVIEEFKPIEVDIYSKKKKNKSCCIIS